MTTEKKPPIDERIRKRLDSVTQKPVDSSFLCRQNKSPIIELNEETKIPVEVHEVQCPKCGGWIKVMKDAKG